MDGCGVQHIREFLGHGLVETDILFILFSESNFSAFQERYAVGAPEKKIQNCSVRLRPVGKRYTC